MISSMMNWITKGKRSITMKDNWFWHSRFMAWVEGALLDLTNWVWNKRHHTPPKKAQAKKDPVLVESTQEPPPPKKAPAKKAAKKAPAKKSTWTAK